MRANPPARVRLRGLQRRVVPNLQSLKSSPARHGLVLAAVSTTGKGESIMSADEAVTRWLRQLEARDQDAARLLWQRYYRELVELARARLGQTPRRMADEEDIALSVLRCLCEGAARGQFAAVVNRQELWQLLATITVRKVINQQRLLKKQKRGGGRVRGDSVLDARDGDGWGEGGTGFDEILGDAATPEVLAIAV